MKFRHAPVRLLTRLGAVAAVSAFALTACDDDDPIGPGEEEHVDAAGFVVESEGTELLRYRDAEGGTPTLTLTAGQTYEVEVLFLDEDGDLLPHEEHEEGEEEDELRITIVDGSVVSWIAEEHGHEDEGGEEEHLAFHGELTALQAGSTQMQLCILHEDHCDYESPVVTVTVQ